jgi:MoxR-like ATPase
MRYVDDPSSEFVVVDVPEGLTPLEAVNVVCESEDLPAGIPRVRWSKENGFLAGDGEGLRDEYRHGRHLQVALAAVEEHEAPAVFVFAVQSGEEEPGRALQRQMEATVQNLTERSVPGKKLIWVGSGDLRALVQDLRRGSGKFVVDQAPETGQPVDEAEVPRVLTEPVPEGAWAFADDAHWPAWIEALTAQSIERLVANELHKPSAGRVRSALDHLCDMFVARDRALEMMVACAIAGANMVFLGPPGTAKSLMVRSFAEALGVRQVTDPIEDEEKYAAALRYGKRPEVAERKMFEYLLTRYTTPEEIFGGADIHVLLTSGVHARRTTGMLPKAEVAFLDEIFKANSAILNTLLSIANERLFYNMGRAFRVNLVFAVGASNETPDSEELGALYDRFPIRVLCPSVPDDDRAIRRVIEQAHAFECAKRLSTTRTRVTRSACLNDLRLLSQIAIGGLYGGTTAFEQGDAGAGDFMRQFLELFLLLRRDYGISDRTPAVVLRICRALALLEPGGPASRLRASHLRAWGYVAPTVSATADLQRFVQSKIESYDSTAINLF